MRALSVWVVSRTFVLIEMVAKFANNPLTMNFLARRSGCRALGAWT